MKLLKKIKISNSVKNVTKISGGTMLGQAISFIVVPIYTRLYGASVMGLWTLFASIANILITFSDLGLKNAIMVEKDEDETTELYTVITTLTLFISLLVSVGVFVYYSVKPDDSGLPSWLIALFVFVLAITLQQTQTCYTWLNKNSEYSILMKNPIVNNLSAAVVIIALGFMGQIKYGYYIGTMVGQIVTLIHMRVHLPKKFLTFNWNSYKKVFAKQKHFIYYQLPSNVLAQIKEQIPVFLIKGFFGAEILGYYSISMKYLRMPITLLAQSIGRVYYQTISKMKREGENLKNIGDYSLKNIRRAMKFAFIPMVVMIAFGDVACEIFFGTEYEIAGNIMRIISFNSFFLFLATATNGLAIIIEKQTYMLACGIAQLIGYVVGIATGFYFFQSIYISCLAMTITYVVAQIIYFAFMFKATKVNWMAYVKNALCSMGLIMIVAEGIRYVLYLFHVVSTL